MHDPQNALLDYRKMLDETAIVSQTDATGAITYVNDKFCALSGYSEHVLLGANHRILNSSTHSTDFYQRLWQTISISKVWRGDICNCAQDGRIYWLNTTIIPHINTETNRPEKYTAISFDITAQKQLQEALFEKEEACRRIFESSGNPILLINDDKIIDCNAAALEHLGYTDKKTVLQLSIADISPLYQPDGRLSAEKQHEINAIALQTGRHHYEWYYQHQDGACFEVEVSATVIPWHNAQVLHTQWRYISERKRLALALHTEKERAEVTLAAIGDAVITTDELGMITFLNIAAITLTGWTTMEAIGKPITEILHLLDEATHEIIENPVMQLLQKGIGENNMEQALLLSREGVEYSVEDTTTPIYLHDGSLAGCVLVLRNVTEKQALLKAVHWQAGHDLLTGLPNRALLADRFNCALLSAQRQGSLLGVCKMDLDGFKAINDLHGHSVGDQLLVAVTSRMNSVIRGEDTLARLGGDEFILLIGNLHHADELKIFLQRILVAISTPYVIDHHTIQISTSIGMSIYPQDNADADTLLRHADQALYQAKQSGRNCLHLFDVEHEQLTQYSYQTRERVRQALLANELCLYYQPKVNMRTHQIVGMEALLRWQHPEKGMVPPLAFLPLVEHSDLIIDIGEWVIEQALQQIAIWSAAGLNWVVSVNIAARHFQHSHFLERLTAILARHKEIPAHLLEIEILETVALSDIEAIRRLIHDCQALGVSFSLDDFGTGYSSLSYLKRLPAETLKVDQSFVRDMLDNKEDHALIEAVIGLAGVFNRHVIAEGVETAEHGVLLMRLGCDLAQGYGIARPMPADAVVPWANEFIPDPSWALWADVPWALTDFPLLVAQYDHLKRLKKQFKVLEYKQPIAADVIIKNTIPCRFDHWYEGEGKLRYQHLPEFSAIAPIRTHIQQQSTRMLELCQEGEFELAHESSQILLKSSERFITQLMVLQLTVANTHLSKTE